MINPQWTIRGSGKTLRGKNPARHFARPKDSPHGQGEEGTGGGPSGDLYLKVEIESHPVFKLNGRDLYMDVPVAPWEAVLGSEVRVLHDLRQRGPENSSRDTERTETAAASQRNAKS